MASWLAASALTVAEADGTPSVSGVNTILVTNTTLTDNAGGSVTIAMTPAGGANTALSNLASVAINAALATGAGTTAALTATALAAIATTQAGIPATLTASAATAGSSTAGAAAGGAVTVTAGAAARKDSGSAAGGSITLTPGAGIGSGSAGTIELAGAVNVLVNKDVTVSGTGKFSGPLTGNVTGDCSGNAGTATSATNATTSNDGLSSASGTAPLTLSLSTKALTGSIAVTPTNPGGAVALQSSTPGTEQTGHVNVSGHVIARGGVHTDADIEAHNIVCTHIEEPEAPTSSAHHQYQRGDLTTPAVSTKAIGSITLIKAAKYETGTVQCQDKEVRATAEVQLDAREIKATGDLDVGVDAAVQAVGDITLVAAAAYGVGDITPVAKANYVDGRATNHLHPVAKASYVTGLSKTVITCIAKADFDVDENPKEGVTVTYLSDNFEFNFDVVGDGSPSGYRVDISGATTAADVATILQAELDAHLPAALAVSRDSGVVTVTGSVPGTSNDITTSDTVVDGDFTTADTAGTVRDYFSVEDGDGVLKFEFDPIGDGLQSGNTADYILNISACTDAASVGAVIVTAIETTADMDIDCNWDTNHVDMIQLTPGAAANAYVLTENVANAGFTVDAATFANGAVRDYFTVNDGDGALKYEFDPVGDGLQSGNTADYILNISACTDAESVAGVMETSLETNSDVSCAWNSTKLDVTLTTVGAQAAAAITENVSNAGFLFTDFTGDADGILEGDQITLNANAYEFNDNVPFTYGDSANTLAAALLAEILETDPTAVADNSSAAALVALKHIPGGVFTEAWALDGSAAIEGLTHNDFATGAAGIMSGETVSINGVTYEFNVDEGEVTEGNVWVEILIDTAVGGNSTTKEDIASISIVVAMAPDTSLVVIDNMDGTLDFVGAIGTGDSINTLITDTVVDAAFVPTGMGQGTDGSTVGVNGIAMGNGTISGDTLAFDAGDELGSENKIFEFTDGNGATGSNVEVDISAAATAILIGAALVTAMNGALTGSPAGDQEDGTVALTIDFSFTDFFGTAGNAVANEVSSANSEVFDVTNFSGGLDGIVSGSPWVFVNGDYVTIHGTGYEFTDGTGAGGGRTEVDISLVSTGEQIASALKDEVEGDTGLIVSVDTDTVSVQHATVAGPTDVNIAKSEEITGAITITNTSGVAGLLDGETITISDGTPTADIYEFDDNDSVTPGNIKVTIGDGTAGGEELAAAIATTLGDAITVSGTAEIDAAVVGTAVNLTNHNTDLTSGGAAGNVAITDTITAAITITGMASGADGLIQGDYFTINDGGSAYVFSFDPEGTQEDETPNGTFYITSAYATAAGAVKTAIIDEIGGSGVAVTAVSGGAAKVNLTSDVLDTNATLTENVSSASFTINDIAVGSTTYSYKVVATFGDATDTGPSAALTLTDCPVTLTANECVHLAWAAVEDATGYDVYRTAGGETQGKIGSTTVGLVFTDTGLAASGAIPTVNDTGTLSVGTGFRLLGYTTAAATPSTTELPLAGDICIHYDSNGGKWYVAFNKGSNTIVKAELA